MIDLYRHYLLGRLGVPLNNHDDRTTEELAARAIGERGRPYGVEPARWVDAEVAALAGKPAAAETDAPEPPATPEASAESAKWHIPAELADFSTPFEGPPGRSISAALEVALKPRTAAQLLEDATESLADAADALRALHKRAQPSAKPEPAAEPAEPRAPAERPSPPTHRCTCSAARSGAPKAHARSCPCYSDEDDAWCRMRWIDERTGEVPAYAEALEAVRAERARHQAAASYVAAERILGNLVMPPIHPPITVRVGEKRGRQVWGEELRVDAPEDVPEDAPKPGSSASAKRGLITSREALEAEHARRHAAAPQGRCGACRACLGQTAQALCERELVASREAVRRLWCHVQALGPELERLPVVAHLRSEVEQLAEHAGVK